MIADVFAGIGPFAVPMAMRGSRVYANDLNPDSVRWLTRNVEANKASPRVTISEDDGRSFVRRLLGPPASASASADPMPFGPFDHVVMNLPANAIEFLDAFVGAFDRRRCGISP